MKKIFLSLVIIFSLSVNAQKATREEVRTKLASAMVTFVDLVSPAYSRGMTAAQFESKLLGSSKPTPEGAALINEAFTLLQSKMSAGEIQAKYSGKEIAAAVLKMESIKESKSTADGSELFGTTGKSTYAGKLGSCHWYQFGCIVQQILDFILDNQIILCFISGYFGHPCP